MKRVTQKWEVIDIDTYDDAIHMGNILNKYTGWGLWEWYSISCLRWNVNDYIKKYIQKIPAKIITPITYDGEWLEIIKKKFWFRYEGDLEILKKWLCRYWIYDEDCFIPTSHSQVSWYLMVPPRDFLLLILNNENNSLSLSQNTIMSTSLETTVNEAYFAEKKIINQASRAVEVLQKAAYNTNQLWKFVGKFNAKINSIKDDINSSFEIKDKVRFVEAINKMNTLFEFLQWDNQWSDILDMAEEFVEEPVEFDPEEYLTN